MAMLEDLENLPMTELETALKKILSQRPDIQSRVLSSQELFDYISWMAETFGHQVHLAPEKIPSFAATADINAIGRKLIDDPGNPLALQRLAAGYTEQSEERYISGGHDISVFRMFRYMPSHWHTNDYFEIYYTFSGSCPIYFRDETINAKPGTILIVAPGILHASPCYSDDCCLVYCMVRASTFERVFWNQLPLESLMSSFFRRALDGGQTTAYLQFNSSATRARRGCPERMISSGSMSSPPFSPISRRTTPTSPCRRSPPGSITANARSPVSSARTWASILPSSS